MLRHYFPAQSAALAALAEEISTSRVEAGVHFKKDNVAGMELGARVARLALRTLAAQAAKTGACDCK